MYCPVCGDVQLVLSERQGVEIDYCPHCRGIWLDRGELDKIIQRANRYDEPSDSSFKKSLQKRKNDYRDDYQSDEDKRSPRRKKRSSFLEEIFDIFD